MNILSCERKSNTSNDVQENFGIISEYDTLFITTEFAECGEWGGHFEKLILTSNRDNQVKARIIVDSISCKEIITLSDEESGYLYSDLDDKKRTILLDSTKQLKKEEEKLISNLIHRIVDMSLTSYYSRNYSVDSIHQIYSGVANYIEIRNSKSTLRMHFNNIDNRYNPGYARARHQIFSKPNNIN